MVENGGDVGIVVCRAGRSRQAVEVEDRRGRVVERRRLAVIA